MKTEEWSEDRIRSFLQLALSRGYYVSFEHSRKEDHPFTVRKILPGQLRKGGMLRAEWINGSLEDLRLKIFKDAMLGEYGGYQLTGDYDNVEHLMRKYAVWKDLRERHGHTD